MVTGGAGFIGSHLVESLLRESPDSITVIDDFSNAVDENVKGFSRDPRVRLAKEDICDLDGISEAFRDADCVFHLAAVKHNASDKDQRRVADTNVLGTYNVLEAMARHHVRKLVYSSSLYVYGTDRKGPYHEDDPLLANTLYGLTKVCGEQMIRTYCTRKLLDGVILRYFFVYGPRLYQKHYQYAFVNKSLDRIGENTPPQIFGDGRQTFDYIYIDDAVSATVLAMKNAKNGAVYNVGSGRPTSINDLCRLILELKGSALKPEFGPKDETFGTHRVSDPGKIKKELGFAAKTELKDGIRQVIEWKKNA